MQLFQKTNASEKEKLMVGWQIEKHLLIRKTGGHITVK